MDEITKRFEIIRLAIQLGDYDTILVQCQQLPKISRDAHLSDIIALLKSKNYRQALYEMRYYAQNLEKSFFTTNSSGQFGEPIGRDESLNLSQSQPPQSAGRESEQEQVIGLDEIMKMADNTKRRVKEYTATPEFPTEIILEQFKRELEKAREKRITSESEMVERSVYKDGNDIMNEEINLPLSEPESMRNLSKEEIELRDDISIELEDFDDEFSQRNRGRGEADNLHVDKTLSDSPKRGRQSEIDSRDMSGGGVVEPNRERRGMGGSSIGTDGSLNSTGEGGEGKKLYLPIAYIDQKYNNMLYQYPPVEDSGKTPEVVKEMKDRLSIREYTDEDIEEFLDYYFKYKEKNQKELAIKVLLLAASTESKFAKFLLGRELFRGDILEKNDTESFNLINSLADQNYPEAICDLGQFYEHGIAIAKDKQMAMLLYEEAAELGVKRAKKHYERLKGSKGVMGILKKLKIAKRVIRKDEL
jgi:hypothetical protein